MTVNVFTTLDISDIWQSLSETEQRKFATEIISDMDLDLIIDELESRGYNVKKDE